MKQMVIPKFGGTEVFQLKESETPEPKADEVRIKVAASGINFADILARKGLYPDAPPLPMVVGYEAAGLVDAVGSQVNQDLLGNRVLAMTRFKGYADYLFVKENQVHLLDEALSFSQAAAIPVNYLTAWQLLVVMGSLSSDETVLIHNAGGGVGLAAIDIAKHIGARIIGTASQKKHPFLLERGADELIDYRNEDWEARTRELTHGKGVELIIDPIGGPYWKKNYKLLRHTGRVGYFGISSASEGGSRSKLGLLKLLRHIALFQPIGLMNANRAAFGVNLGHLWHEAEKVNLWVKALLQGVQDGWVRPHVDKEFPLEQVGEAHAYIEARKNIGKVVLTNEL